MFLWLASQTDRRGDMRFQGGEQVEVTLRALPDDVPFAVRLRAVLKYARRSCRLRCLAVKDIPAFRETDQDRDRGSRAKFGNIGTTEGGQT
jgi:hypothetical protein